MRHPRNFHHRAGIVLLTLFLTACTDPTPSRPAVTAADADAFVARVNADLKRLWTDQARADWVKATYITEDTESMAAAANEKVMAYISEAIGEAQQYEGLQLKPETARMLERLKLSSNLPAPSDPKKRGELASIAARMESVYGKGKWCPEADPGQCKDLQALYEIMAKNRNYDELLAAWKGWRTISPVMREDYARYVALANEGAREIGFKDLAELWRAGYDMSPTDFDRTAERLWGQVKPLYEELQCYVRARLADHYGSDKVPLDGPIPAHLLGNMWAQQWSNIYPLVEPYPGVVDLDVTAALEKQDYDAERMVRLGEDFFTSMGLDPLPDSFWSRSMFVKPRDREVVCHASAWDVTYGNDLRIKMCIRPKEDDLMTILHELGHVYYFHNYYRQPALFQTGAHDGFHEGIGDTMVLSVTPAYLKKVGLTQDIAINDKALINQQLKQALDKIAFLPFGKMIDQWRWNVFAGNISEENYNAAWWELRRRYQGIAPPVARTEADFDPGAKYHIPANVPYTRYFLAHILQFQFHRALCQAAGNDGPLYDCSIYGNPEAGAKLKAMLEMGASRPWPEVLQALSGETGMDASAILDYFAPLMTWLKEQNQGRTCGW